MLEIEYKGGNGVVLSTKKTTAVIDGNLAVVGLKPINHKNVVAIATENRFLQADDARVVIDGPGEYEVGDMSIQGCAAQCHLDAADVAKATMYRLEAGELRVAILGNIAPQLTELQLENLGVVDMVILPVGGNGYTLDATSAAHIARQIAAKVVIPIHYADKGLQYEVAQDTLETFTKEFGQPVESVGGKYKLKGAASLPAVTTVVTIDRT